MEAWRMRSSHLICNLLSVHNSIVLFPDTIMYRQMKMLLNRVPLVG